MQRPFPKTVGELLKQLDELVPELTVTPLMTHDEIIFAGGRRSVVRLLQQWRDGALSSQPASKPVRGQGRPTH